LVCFTMEELRGATDDWAEEYLVGRGACGSVYRGDLRECVRAIKRPHPDVDVATSTFDKELDLLSKLNHRCLVRLVGYCEQEHVLVFEFMACGTLEDCLHGNRLGRCLSWQERLNIAAGASRGLEYLHEYATTLIIHGDVKPANILLDEKLDAHIADFGLSLSSHDPDATMLYATRMGGTPGYFDPEYASLGSFTPKSDVYSFGVVLLELFSGRKVVQERRNITSWASEIYEQDVAAILDPLLERPQGVDSFHSIIALALQCVQTEHRYRPKMKDVAAKLSSAAADWHQFEHAAASFNLRQHPSRRQHPQYRPLSRDADEFPDDHHGP
jgi:serine/threonine protein kinase